MNKSAECPSCSILVDLADPVKMGQTVTCPSCNANLEVIWLDPIELDILIEPDDEDPYDDFEYDYDYNEDDQYDGSY